jgi:parallel beta-helix repeat protein
MSLTRKRTNLHHASLLLAAISITLLWASVAKAATEITQSSCPVVITKPGDYLLGTNVGPCENGVNGIQIQASGVSLVLNGHTITGAGPASGQCSTGTGISVGLANAPMLKKVAIVGGGTISNFIVGVLGQNSANSSVTGVTALAPQCDSLGFGIVVASPGGGWTLVNNVVREPGISSYGIALGVDGNTLAGNNVIDSIGVGIGLIDGSPAVVGSSKNTITNNIANDNLGGVLVYPGSTNNQIVNNITNDNNTAGLCTPSTPCSGVWLMEGATGNYVIGNTSFGNIPFDMEDDNANCGSNKWQINHFKTASEPCIH